MLAAISREPINLEPPITTDQLRSATGPVLRAARRQRGLTLREVAAISANRFKPSALGGYERGERAISLERFCELASVYGIPPDRLLGQVLDRIDPDRRVEVVVDVSRLEMLTGEESRRAAELVARVVSQRGQEAAGPVTLRAGDFEELALAAQMKPQELARRLKPAVDFPHDGA
jgi:transcriptional regulator with XRE-family HTH domain